LATLYFIVRDVTLFSLLEEWSRHTKMQVLIYGAYYEAFHPPGAQYVGGGADVLTVPWPDPAV
jgi:hypothetical protein